jgi:Ca2+-binding RTX toxin-like protein
MLRAGEGSDVAVGGGGDDYFVGDAPGVGVGPDNIDRVGGNDVFHGGAGPDTVNGDAGSDTLAGGDGDDGLFTDDLINGDSAGDDARDLVSGGGGDDFVDAEDGRGLAPDAIGCGAGHDTVLADGADRVSSACEVVR